MWMPFVFVGLICSLASVGSAAEPVSKSASPPPTDVDVAYGKHERQKLDLWRVRSARRTAVVVFIHGGGWRGGDKADVPAKLCEAMLAKGVAVASINYRFTHTAQIPTPLHDAAQAVQYLRVHAKSFNIDPERIAAYGISAGGVSALWLALHDDLADPKSVDPVLRESSRLTTAVGMSPPVCLDPLEAKSWIGDQLLAHPMIARAVGAKSGEEVLRRYDEFASRLREASPYFHVSGDDPPIMASFPRIDPLPATTPGSAIHHALFGEKLKQKCDAVGAICVRRIEERPEPSVPTPEEFILYHLQADAHLRD